MLTVNLYDSAFLHLTCSVHGKTAKRIRYVRWRETWDGITMFTDSFLADGRMLQSNRLGKKVGWLLEPREYAPQNYAGAERNLPYLDLLLTHDQELLDRYPDKARFVPFGGCWIQDRHFGLWTKTKKVSHIMSGKRMLTGHRLRWEVKERYGDQIDHFGRGTHRPVAEKESALGPYQFSVVIENSRARNFFTEKLLDCFAVGTIPIYWGCPNIGDFGFDTRGILSFETLEDLRSILGWIQCFDTSYESMIVPARINEEAMLEYEITDDWIAVNVLEPFIGR